MVYVSEKFWILESLKLVVSGKLLTLAPLSNEALTNSYYGLTNFQTVMKQITIFNVSTEFLRRFSF